VQVSAHWAIEEFEAAAVPTPDASGRTPLQRIGLGTLLAATARRHPARIALIDPADKAAWCGRSAITWTYAAAHEIVERLAKGLRGWRLAPGSRIGLCLPGSTECALAFLAIEAAGHVPCWLPVSWDEERLLAAVQGAGLSAVLTLSRLGSAAPAQRLCAVAARYFGLRYLAAFGPDVPDGVINLDRIVVEGRSSAQPPSPVPASGFVSFTGGDPDRPVFRSGESLLAAAAAHLISARVGPDERILSLLAPHDLRGLVTGLAAALVAGAGLETLPLFDGPGFAAALAVPTPTHLVAPAFLEPNLAGRDLPKTLRSLCLVHRAPTHLPSRGRDPHDAQALRAARVVDTMVFDETALISGLRGSSTDLALTLAEPDRIGLPASLFAMRRDVEGRLRVRGNACASVTVRRGEIGVVPPDSWRSTPYAATLRSGLAIAVEPCPTGNEADEPYLRGTR